MIIIALILLLAAPAYAQSLVASVTPTRVIRITTTNEVSITFDNGVALRDYVTVNPVGVLPQPGYVTNWFYLNGTQNKPTTPIKSGVIKFPVPGVGSYEARQYKDGTTTDPVAVTAFEITLTEISLDGPAATLVRTNSLADDVSIVIVGDTATITAPTDSPVKVNQNPAPGVAVFSGKQAVKAPALLP